MWVTMQSFQQKGEGESYIAEVPDELLVVIYNAREILELQKSL